MSVLRTRVLLALLVVLGLGSFGLALPFSGAATGSDPDGSITATDPAPLAGSTIGVTLAALDPAAEVSVQLCTSTFIDTGTGGSSLPLVVDPAGCRALGTLTTDGSGAASGSVTLPSDGYALGGRCSYEPGPGSFSFGGQAVNDCVLVATTDTAPEDGVAVLASTLLKVGLGTGAISGTVRDGATGEPIDPSTASLGVRVCALDVAAACATGFSWFTPVSAGVTVGPDGTYSISGLPDGRHVVEVTAGGIAAGGDFRTVAVTGGAAVTGADLAVPSPAAPTWANSGGTAVVAVSPDTAVAYDATLDVSGSGFQPGDRVTVHLCDRTTQFAFFGTDEVLAPACPAAPLAGGAEALVADAGGSVQGQVPFDLQRFQASCSTYYTGLGAGSLSFELEPSCRVLLFEATDEPSAAWTRVDFVRPAGTAVVSGTVTADGVPVAGSTLTLASPIGPFSRVTDDAGTYQVADQPDGTSILYARLPSNYFFDQGNGAGSFSFGIGPDFLQRDVTVSGGTDVDADLDFDILPGGVSGTLLDSDGGVPDFGSVSLGPVQGGPGIYLYDQIGADGSYEFRGLPDGSYQLYAYGYNGQGFGFVSRTVTVAGGVLTGVDLRFPRTNSSIAGTVLDQDGNGLTGTFVVACPEGSGTGFGFGCRSTITAPDGTFQVTSLAADTYEVTAYSPLAPLTQASTSVVVGEGQAVTGVELRFTVASGSISGTVTDESAGAVEGASVYACRDEGVGACGWTTTDASGAYTFAGLPDGAYLVQAGANGFNTATTVTSVDGGLDTTGVDLTLSAIRVVPPDTSVGGVDGDGAAGAGRLFPSSPSPVVLEGRCPGATVSYTVTGADGTPWASGTLPETGVPGTYAGEIPPQSGRSGQGELTITVDCPVGVDDPPPVEIDVYIDPSGNVVDTNGDPVVGATVTLLRSDTGAGPFTEVPDGSTIMSPENRTNPDLTDETGAFGWLTVAGYYKVRAEKEGCTSPGDPATASVETPALPVPPEQVGLVLVLDCDGPDDGTPPEVSVSSDSSPNAAGWDDAAVTVTAQASDDGGIASSSLVVDGTETGTTQEVLGDGVHTVAATATDTAGNTATSEPATIRVDTADPTATITGPTAGLSVVPGTVLSAEFACDDGTGSGIAGCTAEIGGVPIEAGGPIDTDVPGPRTLTVTATDVAGRTGSSSVSFTVVPEGDQVSLRFSGSLRGTWEGALTDGDLRVRRDLRGQATAVTGTGLLPGANGGTARVTFDVQRTILGSWLGTIRVVDRNARVDQSTPVLFAPVRTAADGTLSGTASWFTGFFQPYRLQWSVLDRPPTG